MLWLKSMALTETRSSLPPLSALRAFEAAARYRNFTLAAKELNVTPSAVSHQMRQLEKWLGVKLFHRGTRPLQLTEDGSLYYVHLAASFDQLSLVTRRLMGKSAVSILTIATMDSFASDWLVPRLRSLREAHPELDVRISTSDAYVDFDRDAIDIAIRYGNGNWPNLTIELLFDDSMFAVCNPVLVEGPNPIRTPADLARHTLLHDSAKVGWDEWLSAAGVSEVVDTNRGLSFSHSYLALQAAISAQGIALASGPLVFDALADGRLTRLFDLSLPGHGAYYVVYPTCAKKDAKTKVFRDWLIAERSRVLKAAI